MKVPVKLLFTSDGLIDSSEFLPRPRVTAKPFAARAMRCASLPWECCAGITHVCQWWDIVSASIDVTWLWRLFSCYLTLYATFTYTNSLIGLYSQNHSYQSKVRVNSIDENRHDNKQIQFRFILLLVSTTRPLLDHSGRSSLRDIAEYSCSS
jgi:hypothetical protein